MFRRFLFSWSKMRSPSEKQVSGIRKRTVALLLACLFLVVFIGFLVGSNYRSQRALRAANLESYYLDLEKHAAAIAYFFSERKYDLRMMAAAPEIATCFINQSLGMSEPYGLKVSYFNIRERFQKTIREKCLHGDPIYNRLLLLNPAGVALVDTAAGKSQKAVFARGDALPLEQHGPVVRVDDQGHEPRILLTIPCFHDNHFSGKLLAWLDPATLQHLFEHGPVLSGKTTHLITAGGRLICPPGEPSCPVSAYLTTDLVTQLRQNTTEELGFSSRLGNGGPMLGKILPIHGTPLNLLACIPTDEVTGSLAPWQLLVGTGSLAVVILVGVAFLMRFNTQNLILRTRYDESARQQALLAAKNEQLKKEMRRRSEIEKKLEEQRLLRVHSDRLQSLGEMAAGIAHELNQPLVGVRGMAELILVSTENEKMFSREKTRKKAAMIVEQADRMVHIIQHVRLFAREAGRPETEVVNLNEVVRSGMSLVKAQFRAHGLRLETELDQRLLPVRINPYSVEEVLLNLLTNARDAIETKKESAGRGFTPRVRITTRYEGQNGSASARIDVRDNGGGIPQEIADRVFDPYFTTKGPDKGTGLGLSICKRIIEELGGTIRFTSENAVGTTFSINFPVVAKREEEKK